VSLDGERHAGRGADGRAKEDVVGEEEIRRQVLPHGGRVLLDEVLPLGTAQILQVAGLHVLVAV
jgi:hypothetical protein